MSTTRQALWSVEAVASKLDTEFNMISFVAGGTEFVSVDRTFKRPLRIPDVASRDYACVPNPRRLAHVCGDEETWELNYQWGSD